MSSNKHQTKNLLFSLGIMVPRGEIIRSKNNLAQVIDDIGFPVVIKPVRGNNGRGISININNFEDALKAFHIARASSKETSIIVEKFVSGSDYRILVINNKFTAAAKRTPATVIGDGHSTINALIDKLNTDPRRGVGHSKSMSFINIDQTTTGILLENHLTLNSVLPLNKSLTLKGVANISAGGTSTDVTDLVHPHNIFMAERIAKIIGLDICGIDIISPDISIPFSENNAAIVEVNSAPGLRLHMEPAEGTPRNAAGAIIDMLFPVGSSVLIPIIIVFDLLHEMILCSLITSILSESGFHIGCATTKEITIKNIRLPQRNLNYHQRLKLVLKDPTVDMAIFECVLSDVIETGLGFSHCNLAIILNLDSVLSLLYKTYKISDLDQGIALICSSVLPAGYIILNADDISAYQIFKQTKCNIVYLSVSDNNPIVIEHIKNGGCAAFIEGEYIILYQGLNRIQTINSNLIDSVSKDSMVMALAVTLLAYIYNIDGKITKETLKNYYNTKK